MQRASDNHQPRLLVTGGAGYIGSHFVNRYLEQRSASQVVIVDDLNEGNREAVDVLSKRFPERISFYHCKIGDSLIQEALLDQQIRAVVHFAASASVAHSQRDPMGYLRNNVGETVLLLDAMTNAGVRNMVFSSTAAVYGTPDTELIREDEVKRPVNVYGQTKLMVEEMLSLLHERGMLSYVALRYFNAAGADESGLIGEGHHEETHLIPIILQAANGKRASIKIYGNDYPTPDGTCIRDYIHVNDLADAHIAALDYLEEHPGTGMACNLGTGRGNSVREVLDLCRSITGQEIHEEIAPRRDGDPPILVAGADRANQVLRWKAKYSLETIIRTAWRWERNRLYCK
jgi:UDP-glucose 4-epimerase